MVGVGGVGVEVGDGAVAGVEDVCEVERGRGVEAVDGARCEVEDEREGSEGVEGGEHAGCQGGVRGRVHVEEDHVLDYGGIRRRRHLDPAVAVAVATE